VSQWSMVNEQNNRIVKSITAQSSLKCLINLAAYARYSFEFIVIIVIATDYR